MIDRAEHMGSLAAIDPPENPNWHEAVLGEAQKGGPVAPSWTGGGGLFSQTPNGRVQSKRSPRGDKLSHKQEVETFKDLERQKEQVKKKDPQESKVAKREWVEEHKQDHS